MSVYYVRGILQGRSILHIKKTRSGRWYSQSKVMQLGDDSLDLNPSQWEVHTPVPSLCLKKRETGWIHIPSKEESLPPAPCQGRAPVQMQLLGGKWRRKR